MAKMERDLRNGSVEVAEEREKGEEKLSQLVITQAIVNLQG